MHYDPDVPLRFYEALGEKELKRLSSTPLGELLYHVHMDVLRSHIEPKHEVLELAAGSGFFTKELVKMCRSLVTSDLSPKQLAINRESMAELGLEKQIRDYMLLDITDLGRLTSDQFDIVVCTGGALNYAMDCEERALREMLRVTKPSGVLVLGVNSVVGVMLRCMPGIVSEKGKFGIDATRWLLDTGIQDPVHYPVENRHFVHMLKACDLDKLFQRENVRILEKRAAGLFALAESEALKGARNDDELWPLILEKELAWSKLPGTLDCGANIIYVARKL